MFATLDETADSMSGHVFSTDPLGPQPDTQQNPFMATFEMTRDMIY